MFHRFERLSDPFAPHEAITPPAGYWPYMRSQIAPIAHLLPWIALASMVVAIMESGLIFYSGRVIDMMREAGPEGLWPLHGAELVVAALFIMLARPLLIGLQQLFLNQTLTPNLHEQARWRAHRHMLGQSVSYFQGDYAGRLTGRVMQMGPAVSDTVFMAIEAVWYFAVYILGAMLILASTDWRLALPIVIWGTLYALFARRIARKVARASERMSWARSMVTGRIVDAYANIESVRLFADSQREQEFARSAMARHRLRLMRFMRLMTEQSLGLNLLNGFLIVAVVGQAIWLWHGGIVSLGEVAAASALTLRLNGMSGWIMWVTIRLFENAGTIREGLQSLSVPHGVTDRPGAPALRVSRAQIDYLDVSHHYGRSAGGLDHVTLQIAPGERVGLVGRSGAGKSSLVNLLLRFRDTEQGRIEIDGQDIAAVTQDSLRAQIGMVSQDSSLLHRSVRANILYGRPHATEAQMIAAAQRAEADTFIRDLVDPQGRRGYDAHVGERGVKLSGGQRQRIAIARVILKDAPILVLDEATSALDSEVEAAIQQTLYGVMQGKTVIAIAHRLSTIAHMDRIVVLDAGRVAEQGSHAELIAHGGLYAGFWARQSGGFIGLDGEA